jgi:hypothetical protein
MRKAALLLLALPAAMQADEVFLRGGGRIEGVIVERNERSVTLEVAAGRVAVPLARVERIVESRSLLAIYVERASRLAPDDLVRWLALARWARDARLATQAREAYLMVLSIDPGHPEANDALGRVRLGERWMSEDEGYRERGYVQFEGRWVTPEERSLLLRERALELDAARLSRETQARVREAEARAREAEARARRAEADATAGRESGGIPYWPYILGGVIGRPSLPILRPTPAPPPPPDPEIVAPRPPTSRAGPTSPPPSPGPPAATGARVEERRP